MFGRSTRCWFLVALLACGCSDPITESACGSPCEDGLTIQLVPFVPETYRVRVDFPRLSTILDCTKSEHGDRVTLPGVTARNFTVSISWEASLVESTVVGLVYRDSGGSCGGCPHATVEMSLGVSGTPVTSIN